MSVLIKGLLYKSWQEAREQSAAFAHDAEVFRGRVTADGASGFTAEPGRYHLYAAYGDPWTHRTLIVRSIKKLEEIVSLSIVDPLNTEQGARFSDKPGCIPDTVNGFEYVHQLYTLNRPQFTGRTTLPLLWDKKSAQIVNNESVDIMRMFNSEFDAFGDNTINLYPSSLRGEIDRINSFVLENINNGVYKVGFATNQKRYKKALDALFAALDDVDERLSHQRYLAGDQITEADWRLFLRPLLRRFGLEFAELDNVIVVGKGPH